MFNEEIFLKLFQKNWRGGVNSKLFHKASITMIWKPDKAVKIEEKEYYTPKSLMNIYAKILNKILANQIQTILKGSYTMIK